MHEDALRQIERQVRFDEGRIAELVAEAFPVGARVRIKAGQGHTGGVVLGHEGRRVLCKNTQYNNRPRWFDYRYLRVLSGA